MALSTDLSPERQNPESTSESDFRRRGSRAAADIPHENTRSGELPRMNLHGLRIQCQ
jgi:hypothetical protein